MRSEEVFNFGVLWWVLLGLSGGIGVGGIMPGGIMVASVTEKKKEPVQSLEWTLSKGEDIYGRENRSGITELQQENRQRARKLLLERQYDTTTRAGILEWLSAVGYAVTHDLPEMPRQKANTAAYVASVSLKAIQS